MSRLLSGDDAVSMSVRTHRISSDRRHSYVDPTTYEFPQSTRFEKNSLSGAEAEQRYHVPIRVAAETQSQVIL